ncbi:MAG: phosphate ABC transporter permease PstA [Pseudomonadales bacterium]|nr:phosphate ABC transporter permease PstA [Pseudomonadales bacterium]MCP5330950.1 phosphate ABC transporter permease PstA [Pseudomonadales bacterium]MCP5344580.1 phosphate ABC transporter permease PstA [Pseudomonadales bacterium]
MINSVKKFFASGTPWIWVNAGAVAISVIMTVGLLLLLAINGLNHFWPKDIMLAHYTQPSDGEEPLRREIIGERVDREQVPAERIIASGIPVSAEKPLYERELIKVGNRELNNSDFTWLLTDYLEDIRYPDNLTAFERREWGNFYGYVLEVRESGTAVASSDPTDPADARAWMALEERIARALAIHEEIDELEKDDIGEVNYALERLRLQRRALELRGEASEEALAEIEAEVAVWESSYEQLQTRLSALYEEVERDSVLMLAMNEEQTEIRISEIVRAYQPNRMHLGGKLFVYAQKLWEFLSDEPREANTEGGIFPAIFGTVTMVLLMSVFVTPFGVVAAVYLREYARQGFITRTIRIAVNNLAGVPSIVYGVFGLGFFIYFLGSEIDQAFYPEALPAPTFGTPGMLWASLTLALLTVPVVIVSTEEGLARIPRSLREGSLALGATKFETLWRVVLPMASPAMMTGLILAVARAAGEVAPLMLVGVVKLAPTLPINGNYPYFHLDQKFMHLGFHIYDVGFQSPNVEAARPLVFATAFLLVVVIALLNQLAVTIRNRLREKYKALDM